jgi:hypothetical protein
MKGGDGDGPTAGGHAAAWRWIRRAVLLVLLFVGLPWLATKALPVPWAWVFGIWALAALRLAFGKHRGRHPALWFNVMVLCVALASVELYFWVTAPKYVRIAESYQAGYSRPDARLGYRPVAGVSRGARGIFHDELVYDVTYTIDAKGLRKTPEPQDPTAPSLLFFGGSFMFGEGLDDAQTIPAVVSELTDGRYATLNLAFHGYGAHQVLAALQHGVAEEAFTSPPKHVVYLALPAHGWRAAGRSPWDTRGPRYVLQSDGSVRHVGSFDRGAWRTVGQRLEDFLNHSFVWKWLLLKLPPRRDHARLLAALVGTARAEVAQRWPGCRMHVLLWERPPRQAAVALEALRERSVKVHVMADVLPGFAEDPRPFQLHPRDGHPSAEADRRIAEYIVRELLEE